MAIYKDQVDEGMRYLELAKVCFNELKYSSEIRTQDILIAGTIHDILKATSKADRLKIYSTSIEDIKREMNE